MKTKKESFPAKNPNPLFSVEKDGTVLYSNEAGEPLLDEWGVQVGEKLPSYIGDSVQNVLFLNRPEKMVSKVGKRVYLLAFHPSPEEECVDIYGFDISDQKELDGKLLESEEKYRRFFETMQEAFFIADVITNEAGVPVDYRIIKANQALETQTGVPLENLIGNTALGMYPELDPFWIHTCGRVALTGESVHFKYYSGVQGRYYEISAHQIQPGRFGAIFLDITDSKPAEEAPRINEKGYQMLFANMTDGFFLGEIICNKDGKPYDYLTLGVNPAYELILNVKKEQVLGKSILEVDPNTSPIAIEKYGEVALSGKSTNFELFSPVVNRYLDFYVFCPEKGKFAVIIRDITKCKQMEDGLKRNEQRFKDILSSIQDGIFELDHEWRFTYINKRAAQNVGFEPEELIGECIWEKFTWTVNSEHEAIYRKVMETRQPDNREIKSSISNQWYELNVYPSPSGISVFWKNITDRKQNEVIRDAINSINQTIHSTLDFDEIMQKAVSEAAKAIGCETAAISLRKGERWLVSYVHGFPEDAIGAEMNDDEEPHAVLAIRTKKPVAIDDAFNDERVNRSHMQKWGVRSVLVVPLIIRDEVIGVLFFNFHKFTFTFDNIHVNFATQLASSISLALDNSRLFENLKIELIERKKAEDALYEAYEKLQMQNEELQAQSEEIQVQNEELQAQSEEIQVQNEELKVQSEELLKAYETLSKSERQYHLLFEHSIDAIILSDPRDGGKILSANPAACQMLGWSEEELIGKGRDVMFDPEDPELSALLNERIHSGSAKVQLTYRRKDGTTFIGEISSTLFTDINGEPRAVNIIRDVTGRIQMEEALRRSEEQTRWQAEEIVTVMEVAPVAIWIGHDPQCHNITGNRMANEFYEAKIGENVSANATPVRRFFHKGRELTADKLPMQQASLNDIDVRNAEFDVLLPSGEWRTLLGSASPLHDTKGDVRGCVGTFIDITEHKQAEEALRESQTKLEAALASMTDAVFISDIQGNFINFNDAFATFYKFKNKDECAKTFAEYPGILDVFMADGTPAPVDMWTVPRALRGETVTDAEYTLRRKDTGETWIGSYNFAPISDKEGAIVGSVVIGRDITERKRAEEALKESEEKYRIIVENSQEGIWTVDTNRQTLYINQRMAEMLGYTVQEMMKMPWSEFVTSVKERKRSDQRVQERKQGIKRSRESYEMQFRCKDGSILWTIVNSTPLFNEHGEYIGSTSMLTDITERKLAEEALFEAYKQIQVKNEELQTQSEELQTQSEELQAQSEELQMQSEELQAQSEELQAQNEELQAQTEELQEANEALLESEERFRTMANAIPQLAWIARADGYIYWYNERWYAYTGTTPEQMEGWGWQSVHDPAVLPEVLKQWRASILTGQMFDMEFPLRGTDGIFRPFLTRVLPLKDAKGHVLQWFGTNTDVTELKKIEESLRESESRRKVAEAVEAERQRFFNVLETLPPMICLLTPDYHVAFANRSFREKFGESGGRHCYEYCFGLTRPCEFCESYKVVETGQPHHWEVTTPDGSVVDAYDFPFTDFDGSPMILKMNVDITERKRAEEKIQILANTVESSEDAIITKSLDGIITSWNMGAERVYGYSAEEILGKNVSILEPDNLKGEVKQLTGLIQQGESICHYETLRSKKDGTIINVSLTISPVFIESGELIAISTIARDITESKRAEEALRLSNLYNRSLIEASLDPLVTIGSDGKITDVNWATEQVTGYSRNDLIGTDFSNYFIQPEKAREGYQRVFQEGLVRDYSLDIQHKCGRIIPVLYNASVYKNEAGETIGVFAAARDITELKKVEDALAKIDTVRKQEIHHRIKNNLQVISSLLDLQAEKFKNREDIKDSEVLEAFKESQDRVISMALIHEELHKGGEIDTLDFSSYLEELVDNLFLTYILGNKSINLNMDLEESLFFDMDAAIPLGIIVNEIISNSLKHAFQGRNNGEILIKLRREENGEYKNSIEKSKNEGCKSSIFTLSISDDGVGIPESFDIEDPDTLGIQLITSLVDQLEGEFELTRNNGTEFTMRFTVTEKNNQVSVPAIQNYSYSHHFK